MAVRGGDGRAGADVQLERVPLRSGAVRATDAPGDVTVYNFLHFEEVQWGELHAAGTLVMLPVLVFALLVQRYIVRGLVSGALK